MKKIINEVGLVEEQMILAWLRHIRNILPNWIVEMLL